MLVLVSGKATWTWFQQNLEAFVVVVVGRSKNKPNENPSSFLVDLNQDQNQTVNPLMGLCAIDQAKKHKTETLLGLCNKPTKRRKRSKRV